MEEEILYEEILTLKEITSQPILASTFYLSTGNINLEKVHVALHDRFILIKFKVVINLFRKKEKRLTGG